MAAVIGSVVAELLVDGSGFDRSLATSEARAVRFENTLAGRFRSIEQRHATMASRVVATQGRMIATMAKSFAGGFVAPLAGVLTLTAAIGKMKAGLEEFGDISDAAKASGLDSEFLQGLRHAASLGGVSFEQLSASLAGFNRASGQAEAGTGRMATALAKLNPALLANLNAAKSQEERVRLAADAINAAGSASEKAALSVALFGDSGTKLVDVFNGGAEAIDAAMKKARELNLVISRDLIARADEMGDEFDTATKVLDLQFKAALVDLAPILTGTASLIGGVVSAVRGLIEQFSALDARSTSSLEDRLAQIKELQASVGTDITLPSGEIVPQNPMAVSIGGADTAKLEEERKQIEAILTLRKALEVPPPRPPDDGSGGYNAAAQATIDKAQAVLDALKFEEAQLGRTAEQQAIYNNLKSAGVTAQSAFGQQIAEATIRLESQKSAIEANEAAMAEFSDIAKSATRSMIDDLLQGKSAAEAFGNVLGQIGNKLIDMATNQLIANFVGMLFGSFGSIAGGAPVPSGGFIPGITGPKLFAKGGVFSGAGISRYSNSIASSPTLFPLSTSSGLHPFAKGVGLMGEAGPEAIMPLRRSADGRLGVLATGDSFSQVTNAAPSFVINNSMNVMPGAKEEDGAAFARGFARELDRQLPDALERYNRNPHRRK
jgi:hypothetical protein